LLLEVLHLLLFTSAVKRRGFMATDIAPLHSVAAAAQCMKYIFVLVTIISGEPIV
jgi:hypothetical protein